MLSPRFRKTLKKSKDLFRQGYGKLRNFGRNLYQQLSLWKSTRLKSWKRIKRGDRVLGVFLLATWIVLLLALTNVFPGSYVFEGYAIVRELSFTYSGIVEKRFLNTIDNLTTFTIEGRTTENIRLQGKFTSNDQNLNSKLEKLSELTIALPSPTSQISFSSNGQNSRELSLIGLYLRSQTRVNQLAYNSDRDRLSFCLQAASDPLENCLFPEDAIAATETSPIARVHLQFGGQPVEITLADFELPELDFYGDEAQIAYIPAGFAEVQPALLSPATVFMSLPEIEKSESAEPPQWFRGDLDVEKVSFKRFDTGTNVADEIETSTIMRGQVRLKAEKIDIETNQFFIVLSPNPGIQKLRDLQIHWYSPQGLQTRFSGKSGGIATGLYPDFPVQQIQPNWLSYHLSTEAVSALLSFVAACTAFFLPSLFPPPQQKP